MPNEGHLAYVQNDATWDGRMEIWQLGQPIILGRELGPN